MSISITEGISGDVPAFKPCLIKGTSTRSSINSAGQLDKGSITTYVNSGGTLAVIAALNVGNIIAPGDVITISGADGDMQRYNGRHKVTGISGSTVYLATLWKGGVSSYSGILTRVNTGMRVRADIFNNGTFIGSVYAKPNKLVWEIDISGVLKTQFTSIYSTNVGELSTSGMSFDFTVKIFEQWHDYNFTLVSIESASSQQSGTAHRTHSLSSISTSGLLTSNYTGKGRIIHHFLSDQTGLSVKFVAYKDIVKISTDYVDVTMVRKHGCASYSIPAEATKVKVHTVIKGTPDIDIKDVLVVTVPKVSIVTRLYFMNSLGGFSTVECTSFEDTSLSNKIGNITVENIKQRWLTGVVESRESSNYLQDLTSSSEVYDNYGQKVDLVTQSLRYYGNNVTPIILITYPLPFIH